MKNKEKFATEIIETAVRTHGLAYNKFTKEITNCRSCRCEDCLFNMGSNTCYETRIEWANSEYKEPKRFSTLEMDFAVTCDKVKYYARDKDGKLYGYTTKPRKMREKWAIPFGSGDVFPVFSYTTLKFDAIKWEDNEPITPQEIYRA